MQKFTIVLVFIVFVSSCSKKQSGKNVSFEPELTIGANTKIPNGWFNELTSFSVSSDGRIYCLDGQARKVKVFENSGVPLFSFGKQGKGPGEFLYPTDIAYSTKGYVYIMDKGKRNISQFSKEGVFISSVNFKDFLIKFKVFKSGNLVIEKAKIDRKDLKQSQYVLDLIDGQLNKIKSSIYEISGLRNLAWVQASKGNRVFTITLPFSPAMKWTIIGDRLYVGSTATFKLTVLDTNGNRVGEIGKDIEREKVSRADKNKWINETLERYSSRPDFSADILSKNLKELILPKLKPAFTQLAETKKGLGVFLNPKENGIPCILYDKDYKEISQVRFDFDDFEYFNGKYYRITGGIEEPYTLIRYRLAE